MGKNGTNTLYYPVPVFHFNRNHAQPKVRKKIHAPKNTGSRFFL